MPYFHTAKNPRYHITTNMYATIDSTPEQIYRPQVYHQQKSHIKVPGLVRDAYVSNNIVYLRSIGCPKCIKLPAKPALSRPASHDIMTTPLIHMLGLLKRNLKLRDMKNCLDHGIKRCSALGPPTPTHMHRSKQCKAKPRGDICGTKTHTR